MVSAAGLHPLPHPLPHPTPTSSSLIGKVYIVAVHIFALIGLAALYLYLNPKRPPDPAPPGSAGHRYPPDPSKARNPQRPPSPPDVRNNLPAPPPQLSVPGQASGEFIERAEPPPPVPPPAAAAEPPPPTPWDRLICTREQVDIIRDIIKVVVTSSPKALYNKKEELTRRGTEGLRGVHPLMYLYQVFSDQETRDRMPALFNHTILGYHGKRNELVAQLLYTFAPAATDGSLNELAPDFARLLGLEVNEILPFFDAVAAQKEENLKKFIEFLIEKLCPKLES